jgi:hypothetical protein
VRREGERLMMLETIREYALDVLDEDAERLMLARMHAGWLIALGECIEAEADTGSVGLEPLRAELANIGAALGWTIVAGERELALRLLGALRPALWWDHLPEAISSFEQAACYLLPGPLHVLGDLALDRLDLAEAAASYRQALRLAADGGSMRDTAYCLAGLAAVGGRVGPNERAAKLWGAAEHLELLLQTPLDEDRRQLYQEHVLAARPAMRGSPQRRPHARA